MKDEFTAVNNKQWTLFWDRGVYRRREVPGIPEIHGLVGRTGFDCAQIQPGVTLPEVLHCFAST